MSYPKKLTREAILGAAITHIEQHGHDALSMRTLAAELGVTPNAMYRYFPSKTALEHGIADEAGRVLLESLQATMQGCTPLEALPALARAYLNFARSYPSVYGVMMRFCRSGADEPASHARLWELAQQLLATVHPHADPDDLAMALWAYLHGLVELDRADLLDGKPMESVLNAGMAVFLAGLAGSAR